MPDEPLTPASRDDLVSTLAYGLCFNESGKPHRHAQDSMARIAAETLARHLERSGFVVMKKPPMKAHSTSTGPLR
jgi:hypothetical protein